MYSTYQMMSNATNKQYLDKTLEELVEDYKKPNVTMSVKNKIFAAMFVKLFPMMLKPAIGGFSSKIILNLTFLSSILIGRALIF